MAKRAALAAVDAAPVDTRTAIIKCAESLFAEFGIEGVSFRQIGAAIGSANTSVVSYHFGTKAALLSAIINHQLPDLERRRGQLLLLAHQQGKSFEVATLVEILYLPFFEQTDRAGCHSYAAFMSQLLRADLAQVRDALSANYPITGKLVRRIQRQLLPGAVAHFKDRILLVSAMIFAALHAIDRCGASGNRAKCLFSDALAAAVAVFEAEHAASPVPDKS